MENQEDMQIYIAATRLMDALHLLYSNMESSGGASPQTASDKEVYEKALVYAMHGPSLVATLQGLAEHLKDEARAFTASLEDPEIYSESERNRLRSIVLEVETAEKLVSAIENLGSIDRSAVH